MISKQLAKDLQRSKLVPTLLDELRAGYVAAWESAADIREREHQWRLVKTLEDLREHVDSRIRDLAGDGREQKD